MKKLTIYKSENGKIFLDKKECKQYEKQFIPTVQRLIFIYVDLVNKLFKAAESDKLTENDSRKINHYRQLLDNNIDKWNHVGLTDGLTFTEFLKRLSIKFVPVYKIYLSEHWTTLYIDPYSSIKELLQDAKKYKNLLY